MDRIGSDARADTLADAGGWVAFADTRTDTWAERACTIAGRNLTQAEWTKFFSSRTYHATCPEWPAGS